MASTRRAPPMEIFQDPVVPYDHHDVAEAEAALLSAFQPLPDASSDENIILNPPNSEPPVPSPRKSTCHSSSPTSRVFSESDLNSVMLPPPKQRQLSTDSPPKRPILSSKPSNSSSKTQRALFTTFSSAQAVDKENIYSSSVFGENAPLASDPIYGYKAPAKRPMIDAAPLKERGAKKQKVPNDEPFSLPAPDSMPAVEDDGNKPPFSYATLIGMAILRAPGRRLTLAQIYKWISDTFKFYQTAETGWQNSIRHNLSLNKAFVKQERPKENPGKGNYWAIEPGCERQFLKDKSGRRNTNTDGHPFIPEMTRPSTAPSMNTFPSKSNPTKTIDSSKFPEETELSSDATIPFSDPAMHDGQDPETQMPPPARVMRSSPPPEIHSSPPPPISRSTREGTPPALPHFPSNSRSGGRKRRFGALGDSGYYSSIESSAARGHARQPLLTSEGDMERPIIKRGRAEEEIARIRSSSYDSPSKTRPYMKHPSHRMPSSSPFRGHSAGNRNPLTPAVVFKRPAKPPVSMSPNTHLKNHRNRIRQLIGSPEKTSAPFGEDAPWSPAFHIPEEESFTPRGDLEANYDVFQNSPLNFSAASAAARGSPNPRSSRCHRVPHAFTATANVLADITSARANSRQHHAKGGSLSSFNTPSWSRPFLRSPMSFESPSRSPSKAPPTSHPVHGLPPTFSFLDAADADAADDLFGVDLPSDASEEGIDILQGFGKIGALPLAAEVVDPSPSKPSRPRIGRSSTSLF